MVSIHSRTSIGRKPNAAGYYDKLPTIPKGESADETPLLHHGGSVVDTGACWCPEAVSHSSRLKRIVALFDRSAFNGFEKGSQWQSRGQQGRCQWPPASEVRRPRGPVVRSRAVI